MKVTEKTSMQWKVLECTTSLGTPCTLCVHRLSNKQLTLMAGSCEYVLLCGRRHVADVVDVTNLEMGETALHCPDGACENI